MKGVCEHGRRCGRLWVLGAVSSVAVVLFLALSPLRAQGQAPIGPLLRLPERAGAWEYEMSLDVIPGGTESAAWTPTGEPSSMVQQRYILAPQLSLRYAVSDRLSLRARATSSVSGWREGPSNAPSPPWRWSAFQGYGSLGVGWRWAPRSRLDPRLDVQVHTGNAAQAEAHVSVSQLRDPVVLTGALGVIAAAPGRGAEREAGWGLGLMATARAAFVANDRISFVAGVSHLVPTGMQVVPATTLSFGIHYALDGRTGASVGLETTVSLRGSAVQAGFRVSWIGRREP